MVENARTRGPQIITRNGRRAVVVVSVDDWERKSQRKGSLADYFVESPLRDGGVEIERVSGGAACVSQRLSN